MVRFFSCPLFFLSQLLLMKALLVLERPGRHKVRESPPRCVRTETEIRLEYKSSVL